MTLDCGLWTSVSSLSEGIWAWGQRKETVPGAGGDPGAIWEKGLMMGHVYE